MNLDDELRGTLLTHADDAPSGTNTLDAVRGRVRRLDMRRRLGIAGVAAAAVIAVAAGVPYALGAFRQADGLPVGGGPVTAATTSPPPRPSTVALGPPTFTPVTFPLNPSWTPPGLGQPTEGRIEGGLVRLVYLQGQNTYLIAIVSDELSGTDWTPATTDQTTVGGRPATLTTGTDYDNRPVARITWQLANQKWVDVTANAPITAAQVQQYANGLQAAPKPPTPLPFTLALAPEGYQVAYQEISPTEFHLCLAPPDDSDMEQQVCTSRNEAPEAHGGEQVQVGDDPGEIHRSDGLVKLVVFRPGFEFVVVVNENGPLNDEDLIRFAAGVAQA
jgi:hypothetical protein